MGNRKIDNFEIGSPALTRSRSQRDRRVLVHVWHRDQAAVNISIIIYIGEKIYSLSAFEQYNFHDYTIFE